MVTAIKNKNTNNNNLLTDLKTLKEETKDESNQYITINDIKKYGKFFALKTPIKALKQAHTYNQYQKNPKKFLEENPFWEKHGKKPKLPGSLKSPEIDRNTNPKGYNGLNDNNWGSALLCNEIEDLKGYLTVIDIDNDGEIPLENIKKAFSFIMDKTRVHKTGSGGYHIYLFSKEKPRLPQPSINIDYQKNGKYVVFDYRYAGYSNEKLVDLIDLIKNHYMELANPDMEKSIGEFIKSYKLGQEKLEYKPINDMDILVVKNSDNILEKGLNKLGIQSNRQIAIKSDIHNIDFDDGDYTFEGKVLIEALTPFFTKGHFHDLGFHLAGFLYKNHYSEKFTKNLLNSFNKEGKGDIAIKNILDSVYRHEPNVEVAGWNSLSEYINGYTLEDKKKNYLLDMLYRRFKRDITHPENIYEYKDDPEKSILWKLIKILKEYFSPKSSELESEKLLYYFYKKGIIYNQIKTIFKALFGDKYWLRLKNAKKIFNERKSKLHANTLLSYMVGNEKMNEIEKIYPFTSEKYLDFIKDKDYYFKKIQELNDDDKKIPAEVFHAYMEVAYHLKVNETGTAVYQPTNRGYTQITFPEFSKLLIDEFDTISIPRSTIEKAFYNMNQILPVKHNIIHFKNGSLEIPEKALKPIFKENEFLKDALPKITFPFNWNPKANGGKIRKIIEEALTLEEEGFDDNLKIFLKSLGHSCMGKIENHIITILVGPPGTAKSTLLMMLKRGLTFSEVSIPDIVKNERFVLTPVVGKDINIVDDLQSNMIKGIGNLNTFIAGNGGLIEIKHSNARAELNSRNTPKIWGASNNLPPVLGDGFKRRLILIKVPKIIDPKDMDINLQNDILEGEYDDELEWLYYTAITTYLEERNMPFVSDEQKEMMFEDYQNKSDSLYSCVNELFEFSKNDYIENGDVKEMINKWHDKKVKDGDIFEEQKTNISSQKIRKALERLGADKTRKTIPFTGEDGLQYSEQRDVYMDIRKKKKN